MLSVGVNSGGYPTFTGKVLPTTFMMPPDTGPVGGGGGSSPSVGGGGGGGGSSSAGQPLRSNPLMRITAKGINKNFFIAKLCLLRGFLIDYDLSHYYLLSLVRPFNFEAIPFELIAIILSILCLSILQTESDA